MPYICLAQDLPDGTLNILDLFPNTSLRNLIYDPQGQTKYTNRVQNDLVVVNTTTGDVQFDANGLGAYLVDRTEPGALQVASGTITDAGAGASVGDAIIIGGVQFDAVPGAPGAPTDFTVGVPPATINNLNAAILASQPLIDAANPGITVAPVITIPGLEITISAVTFPGLAPLPGSTGDLPMVYVPAGPPAMILNGDPTTPITAMFRANPVWIPADLAGATAALIARLDGGLTLTLAAIDAILTTTGAELTNAGGSASTGTVEELLSVMAGRGYVMRAGSQKYTAPTTWDPTQRGGFTENVLVFDTEFNANPNGTLVPYENKPIRHTYDSGSLQESALIGHLFRYANGVVLFPDSDLLPPIAGQQAQIDNARVVTVYNDDGTVIV